MAVEEQRINSHLARYLAPRSLSALSRTVCTSTRWRRRVRDRAADVARMSTTEPHVGPISGWYAHAAWREREVDVHDADCTFSPRISEYSHLLQRSSGPTAMYERGVELLQERESHRQAEQERLVPNFTPASFTLDHVELAEAAELLSLIHI